MGTQPTPRSQASAYCRPTSMLSRTPCANHKIHGQRCGKEAITSSERGQQRSNCDLSLHREFNPQHARATPAFSVIAPWTFGLSRSAAVTTTSSRRMCSWLGPGMCLCSETQCLCLVFLLSLSLYSPENFFAAHRLA